MKILLAFLMVAVLSLGCSGPEAGCPCKDCHCCPECHDTCDHPDCPKCPKK